MNSPTMPGFGAMHLPYSRGATLTPTSNTNIIINPPTYRICDIALNLCDDMFRGVYNGKQYHSDDVIHVLDRAKSLGVCRAIITGTTLEDSLEAMSLISSFPSEEYSLFSTAGIHPTRSDIFGIEADVPSIVSSLTSTISRGIASRNIVAIGECGLDYDRLHFCNREHQLISFIAQLELGLQFDLPFFFHNRNTAGEFYRIVREHKHMVRHSGVVHSFDGTLQDLEECISLGLYVGVNGCSLKTEENIAVVKAIPLDLLLIETDSPWCSVKASHAGNTYVKTIFPGKKRDKYEKGAMVKDRGEPCLLVQVLEIVAAVKGLSVEELADVTWANSNRLFKLD